MNIPHNKLWNFSYEVLSFHYLYNKKFGVLFSPFCGIIEYQDNSSLYYDSKNFFNIKMYYGFLNIPIGNDYEYYDEKDLLDKYILIGPYISSNYLNIDYIHGLSFEKMRCDVGLLASFHGRIRKTPFESFIELKLGYRCSNFEPYAQGFYFNISFDIIGSALGLAYFAQDVQNDYSGWPDNPPIN
jgi:hypothetical protein